MLASLSAAAPQAPSNEAEVPVGYGLAGERLGEAPSRTTSAETPLIANRSDDPGPGPDGPGPESR